MSLSLHILVADDQPEVTSYLQDYLSGLGHRVGVAANGIEALTMVSAAHREQDSFHLLLVDARMPMLDGISLVRELRRGRDPTDIAFITGDETILARLDQEAQSLGCLMVLAKPFDPGQLAQLVEFVAMRKGSRRGVAAARPPSAALEPVGTQNTAEAPAQGMSDEYMPTSAGGGTARQAPERDNARRANTYYPEGPEAQLGSVARTPLPMPTMPIPGTAPTALPPNTGSFRGGAIPVALPPDEPQIVPGRTARQVPPLPPVPAPVAQPPRGDIRTTSRIGALDHQRDLRPPPTAIPLQPAQNLRPPTQVGPFQPAQNLRPPTQVGSVPGGQSLRPPSQVGPVQPPRGDARTTSRVAPLVQPAGPKLPPSIDPNARRTPVPGTAPPLATPLRDPRRASQIMPPQGIPQPMPPPAARQPPQHGQPPRAPAMLDPDDAQSARIRRTVNGALHAQAQDGSTARMVACVSCGNAFRATLKAQSYNVVCVHCGQLNRIDP